MSAVFLSGKINNGGYYTHTLKLEQQYQFCLLTQKWEKGYFLCTFIPQQPHAYPLCLTNHLPKITFPQPKEKSEPKLATSAPRITALSPTHFTLKYGHKSSQGKEECDVALGHKILYGKGKVKEAWKVFPLSLWKRKAASVVNMNFITELSFFLDIYTAQWVLDTTLGTSKETIHEIQYNEQKTPTN